jgi:hypothetical protein
MAQQMLTVQFPGGKTATMPAATAIGFATAPNSRIRILPTPRPVVKTAPPPVAPPPVVKTALPLAPPPSVPNLIPSYIPPLKPLIDIVPPPPSTGPAVVITDPRLPSIAPPPGATTVAPSGAAPGTYTDTISHLPGDVSAPAVYYGSGGSVRTSLVSSPAPATNPMVLWLLGGAAALFLLRGKHA